MGIRACGSERQNILELLRCIGLPDLTQNVLPLGNQLGNSIQCSILVPAAVVHA